MPIEIRPNLGVWEIGLAIVLVIDDSKIHREALRVALEAAGEFDTIIEAEDGTIGLTVLLTTELDAVVCDVELPGFDGEKLLLARRIKQVNHDIPFIFATGSRDINRRVRLLEAGAQDVILKPYNPRELIARLRGHLLFRQLRRDLFDRNLMLEQLSTTDPLTHLRNRRYIDEVLTREISRAQRHKTPVSIMMIDLDHFKGVNDEFGHAAGDEVLRETARRIGSILRSSDIAARYGGEEFLIVLMNESQHGASIAAERWRSTIASEPYEIPGGKRVEVTASLGVATYSPAFASEAEFVASADAALYRAKENGRNRVECT